MDSRQAQELDRYITGNYGEDQFTEYDDLHDELDALRRECAYWKALALWEQASSLLVEIEFQDIYEYDKQMTERGYSALHRRIDRRFAALEAARKELEKG